MGFHAQQSPRQIELEGGNVTLTWLGQDTLELAGAAFDYDKPGAEAVVTC